MLLEFTPWWKARLGRPREAIYLRLFSTAISLLFPHFVSNLSSLPTFIFCFSCLFTPGRRKATMRLLYLNCPTPFNVPSGWRKNLSLGLSCIYFSSPAVTVTQSLWFIFHLPGCPGKLCPCQSQPEWCLASLGGCKHGYRWCGSEKITEPPKVMSEAPGSSLERDWIIWNPAPLPQLLPFPLLLLTDGGPRTSTLPPDIKNKL